MAYIYKITNIINGKSYIGKTYLSIEERFKQHIQDSKKARCENRPLYSAMSKYGIENFKIEVVEETNIPAEREIYWIKFYNTYGKTGYNATIGGDGKRHLDHDKIISDYLKYQERKKVAEINNCSSDSVTNILELNHIPMKTGQEVMKNKYSKKVQMVDRSTLDIVHEFDSQKEAAQFLIDNHYTSAKSVNNISGKIGMVCKGKRGTAYGYLWRYM